MIYFIQSGTSGPIKIGYTSRDINDRLKQLQTGSWEQLTIIKAIDGDIGFEQELHRSFATYHIRGEWFWPVNQIKEYINDYVEYIPRAIIDTQPIETPIFKPKSKQDIKPNIVDKKKIIWFEDL